MKNQICLEKERSKINHEANKLGILYLGSKGAGVKFLELLSQELIEGKEIHVFVRSELHFALAKNVKPHVFNLPISKASLFFGLHRRKIVNQILKTITDNGISSMIIPMAHPWDLYLEKRLLARKTKIIRIIHDSKKHPGDFFPSNRQIRQLCQSETIVTLSNYTSREIERISSSRIVTSIHPFLPYINVETASIVREEKPDYDLIIGRLKRYQNVYSVAKWWTRLPPITRQNRYLLVAGDLGIRLRILLKVMGVQICTGWLSEGHFVDLVSNANRILCLYNEASQSGVVSIAQQFGVPVLATDVGALPEQISSVGGGLIVRLEDKSDWTRGYGQLNGQLNAYQVILSPTEKFVRDIERALNGYLD